MFEIPFRIPVAGHLYFFCVVSGSSYGIASLPRDHHEDTVLSGGLYSGEARGSRNSHIYDMNQKWPCDCLPTETAQYTEPLINITVMTCLIVLGSG